MDITTDWFSGTHLKWIFALALPMVVIYVIGAPLGAFIVLYKNRNKLDQPQVLRYIILLYQGLKHSKYYWELVNTFRKTMLLALHVFIPDELKLMKALIGCFMMFAISIIQLRVKPFKIEIISTLEHREMVSSLLTLYGGLIFAQNDNPIGALNVIFFIVIMIVNARFLVLWMFCSTAVYKKRPLINSLNYWIKKAFCIKVSKDDENFLSYRSKITTEGHETKSKHSQNTATLPKHTTDFQNLATQKQMKKILKEVESNKNEEDPEISVRTPKKLLGSDRHGTDIVSKRMMKAQNPTKLQRRKTKKSKLSTKGNSRQTDAMIEEDKANDLFANRFRQNSLQSRMGESTAIIPPVRAVQGLEISLAESADGNSEQIIDRSSNMILAHPDHSPKRRVPKRQ